MKLYKMIETYLKYDNMPIIRTINAFICINTHVNSCINNMLSHPPYKPCVNSLISSLSLLVKSFEEEIQPSGDRVDTARG